VTSPRHPSEQSCELDGISHVRCEPEAAGRNVWLRDLGRVRALARSIERVAAEFGDIEVLHAHSPMLCGLAALRAGAALRVPVVLSSWSTQTLLGIERPPPSDDNMCDVSTNRGVSVKDHSCVGQVRNEGQAAQNKGNQQVDLTPVL